MYASSNEVLRNAVAEPVREGEILRANNNLSMATENLESQIERLESRISPVLSGGGVQSNEKAHTPDFSSGMGQEINKHVRKIRELGERLAMLCERVEL